MELDPAMILSVPKRGGRSGAAPGAFSLLELLIVVAIMITLMALATPALTSLLDSGNLARGGQVLADEINLARQLAASQNRVVEVRILKHDTPPGFGSLQIWGNDAGGASVPLGKVMKLPQSIVISENTTVSAALEKTPTGTMPTNSSLSGKSYAYLRIRPSGAVDPSLAMSNFFFSVVSARSGSNSALPPNYVTIQINPLTGTPLVYRP